MAHIGEKLHKIRMENGLAVFELSKKAQMRPSHIVDIEEGSGNPTLAAVDRICYALGVDSKEVIKDTPLQEVYEKYKRQIEAELAPIFNSVQRKIDGLD